jgi:hypothetical protein
MLQFSASAFCSVVSNLDTLRHHHYNRLQGGPPASHSEAFLNKEQAPVLAYLQRNFHTPMFSTVLAQKVDRLAKRLSDSATSPVVCCTLIDELKLDLQAELQFSMFVAIGETKTAYFQQNEPLFGTEVADIFPDASRDIFAAGRSYAFELWTATVFHLMRVLEHGLRPMAKRFDVPFTVDSWHKVVKGIEDGLTDLRNKPGLSDQERNEITYYSDAAAQFRHFKDAWRNHVSHSREHYDEADAEKVMTHVREFMQHLAKPV